VFRLNLSFNKGLGHAHKDSLMNRFVEFDPQNFEKVMNQISQQRSLIESLEKNNSELEERLTAFQNIILEYESIVREEISLYRLQKSKLTTIEKAFEESESFGKEVEQQITTFIDSYSPQETIHDKFDSLKRIIFRFFHQNKVNKKDTLTKLTEINELICNKQQLLDRFQLDVKCWKKNMSLSLNASKPTPKIKQAVGL